LKSVSEPEDLLGSDGLLKQLTARLVERALQAEMTQHLGFEATPGNPSGAENGRSPPASLVPPTCRPFSPSSPRRR